MLCQVFLSPCMAPSKCRFSLLQGQSPLWMQFKVAWFDWEEVSDGPTKNNLGRTESSVSVRCVSVEEEFTQKLVSV